MILKNMKLVVKQVGKNVREWLKTTVKKDIVLKKHKLKEVKDFQIPKLHFQKNIKTNQAFYSFK